MLGGGGGGSAAAEEAAGGGAALCDALGDVGGETIVDCAAVPTLPTVHVSIGGRDFPLAPEQYVLQVGAGSSTQCVSGFIGIDLPAGAGPLWILGDVFLGAYHAWFDYGANKVGFATAA